MEGGKGENTTRAQYLLNRLMVELGDSEEIYTDVFVAAGNTRPMDDEMVAQATSPMSLQMETVTRETHTHQDQNQGKMRLKGMEIAKLLQRLR